MVKSIAVQPVPYCSQIRCDKCGHSVKSDEDDFIHFITLDFDASWGSALGDGNHVDLDLCHACVKEVLGPWLRISNSAWNGGPRRVGLLKWRIMQHPLIWQEFFESDQTVSEDFENSGRESRDHE